MGKGRPLVGNIIFFIAFSFESLFATAKAPSACLHYWKDSGRKHTSSGDDRLVIPEELPIVAPPYRGTMKNLFELVASDPVRYPILEQKLRAVVQDRNGAIDLRKLSARQKFLGMILYPKFRRSLSRAALSELRQRSRELTRELRRLRDTQKIDPAYQAYDVILRGGGIHAGIIANVLNYIAPWLRVLVIEKTGMIAPTFARAGHFFPLNSPGRKSRRTLLQTVGEGDLNYLPYGPFQVSDFENHEFPWARSLSEAAVLNQDSLDADIVMFHEAEYVEDRYLTMGSQQWPARNRIQLDEGLQVFGEWIIDASGLGNISADDIEGAEQIIREELEKYLADFTYTPRVMTWETAAELTQQDNAYERFVGQSLAAIGAMDSGRTLLQYFLRQAQIDGDTTDPVGEGLCSDLMLVGESAKDDKELKDKLPPRYIQLAGAVKNLSLHLQDGRLKGIARDSEGRPIMRIQLGDKILEIPRDYVVLTTGPKNHLHHFFRTFATADEKGMAFDAKKNPIQNSSLFEKVMGVVPGFAEFAFGKRLVLPNKDFPQPQIFVAGTVPVGSFSIQPEVKAGEGSRFAIFSVAPRSVGLAFEIAKLAKPLGYERPRHLPKPLFKRAKRKMFWLEESPNHPIKAGLMDDLYFVAKLGSFLERFDLSGANAIHLSFGEGSNGRFFLKFNRNVNEEAGETLVRELIEDPEVLKMLPNLFKSGSRNLDLIYAIKNKGEIDYSKSGIHFRD